MIITVRKTQLPKQYLYVRSGIEQKNRIVCRKSFRGFPKKHYNSFCCHAEHIISSLRNLTDICFEGKCQIQITDGVRRESGFLWVYEVESEPDNDIEHRLRRIKQQIDKLLRRYPFPFTLKISLQQWISPSEPTGVLSTWQQMVLADLHCPVRKRAIAEHSFTGTKIATSWGFSHD